jgi:hypothetical protein
MHTVLHELKSLAKSIHLDHSMPNSWESDLAVWKGNRKFNSYAELHQHIESKVRNEAAKTRYTMKLDTPESANTRAKQDLAAGNPLSTTSLAASVRACAHCSRTNHVAVD